MLPICRLSVSSGKVVFLTAGHRPVLLPNAQVSSLRSVPSTVGNCGLRRPRGETLGGAACPATGAATGAAAGGLGRVKLRTVWVMATVPSRMSASARSRECRVQYEIQRLHLLAGISQTRPGSTCATPVPEYCRSPRIRSTASRILGLPNL